MVKNVVDIGALVPVLHTNEVDQGAEQFRVLSLGRVWDIVPDLLDPINQGEGRSETGHLS